MTVLVSVVSEMTDSIPCLANSCFLRLLGEDGGGEERLFLTGVKQEGKSLSPLPGPSSVPQNHR